MTTALQRVPRSELAQFSGSRTAWARDLLIVGGVTGAAAPGLVLFEPGFALAGGLVGALSGAALGVGIRWTIDHLRHRIPLSMMILGAPVVGALWGGGVGTVAGLVSTTDFGAGAAALGLFFGGISGAVQLGWLWMPYTFQSVLGRRRWPVVALACLLGPMLGWLSVFAFFSLITPIGPFLLGVALPLLILGAFLLEREVRDVRRSVRAELVRSRETASGSVGHC